MTYSVYNEWDRLKTCIVGRSYSPEFYKFIKNIKARVVLERIAQETEEDFQKLISILNSFNINVLRPELTDDYQEYLKDDKILPPPYSPRDYTAVVDDVVFFGRSLDITDKWNEVRGADWPDAPLSVNEFLALPEKVKKEALTLHPAFHIPNNVFKQTWGSVIKNIRDHGNDIIFGSGINTAELYKFSNTLIVGNSESETLEQAKIKYKKFFPNKKIKVYKSDGHLDAGICIVNPQLIVGNYRLSGAIIKMHKDLFPDAHIFQFTNENWNILDQYRSVRNKNHGKWWVPGEELNDDFTDFVETWLDHWVGFVEETVFDVNMLVIDEKNVVVNSYNKEFFKLLEELNITPHICTLRHRYFWDSGLHCVTSDIHRESTTKN